jgi:BCD family chlorophyll transporter-like MFS transporter
MMIVGFIVSAAIAGQLLDPFSMGRLIEVTFAVGLGAVVVTSLAVFRMEPAFIPPTAPETPPQADGPAFREALRQVWSEPQARRFTLFLCISMLAFSAQDLILEPFAGAIFGLTPGESTKLAGFQNAGILVGMALLATIGTLFSNSRFGAMRGWRIASCLASAVALLLLAVSGYVGESWPLRESVFLLGVANGAFAVAAIGSMMGLVGAGHAGREGLRMGLWGAAQALAFGIAGILSTLLVDVMRMAFDSTLAAYSLVFGAQALLFAYAAFLATRIENPANIRPRQRQEFKAGHALKSSAAEVQHG